MSLVAYDASSEEDTDSDSETIPNKILKKDILPEDNSSSTDENLFSINTFNGTKKPSESLFTYKESSDLLSTELTFNLPSPQVNVADYDEKDDEFLRKKPIKTEIPTKTDHKRVPVKIYIPSLSEFDEKSKGKVATLPLQQPKPCGLLNLLPKPKSNYNSIPLTSDANKHTTTFIPNSVTKNKEAAKEKQERIIKALLKQTEEQTKLPTATCSDESGDEGKDEDYFSLNIEDKLPEANIDKINSMVAEKVAKMHKTANKFMPKPTTLNNMKANVSTIPTAKPEIDKQAIQALCGSRGKRSRMQNMNIIELSGEEVLPNKDEWMRNQLTAATEYQPRGLVDEEPAAGTRKKHQITYLAHQAKANEQELQAMWASNRHTRRLTQNKYGF